MTKHNDILKKLGLKDLSQGDLAVHSPIDGAKLGSLVQHAQKDIVAIAEKAEAAFKEWRMVPAPIRGEFVRLLGHELRAVKEDLGRLVTLESGKAISEGLGEVQEMIDICDFAVGQARQIYGKTMPSERGDHELIERWQPLGPIGIITAFNFPAAVWSWNAALALVCGNSLVWKPSEKTLLTALACQKIFERAVEKFKAAGHFIPQHLSQVVIGRKEVGEALVAHEAFPLISATGSVPMGRAVAKTVAGRLGRSLLELGGNNASIVTPSADLKSAIPAIMFGAVGTAGQRCTTMRRLIVHEDIYDKAVAGLVKGYGQLAARIGDPLDTQMIVGPLIDKAAFDAMQVALKQAVQEGGKILTGGERVMVRGAENGYYVQPALVAMPKQTDVVRKETFAPILYVMKYRDFSQAIAMQNDVPQGLSSNIFTLNAREAGLFTGPGGSDCGIANINVGTSGAEIGGAFGGEKETGGGRESGSDSWQVYMRRQTTAANYSDKVALAQGIKFDL